MKKQRIILLVAILLVVTAAAVFLYISKNNEKKTVTVETPTQSEKNDAIDDNRIVKLINSEKYKADISETYVDTIQSALYNKLDNPSSTIIEGVIKDESYKKQSTDELTKIVFIVDIQALNVSYLVRFEKSHLLESNSLYIDCAPAESQINGGTCDKTLDDSFIPDSDSEFAPEDGEDSIDDTSEN